MSKKILITGASGFIGKRLSSLLSSRGYILEYLPHSKGCISKCNIPFQDIDHTFHLAGKLYVPESWEDPVKYYDINVNGTLNVLEFCKRTNTSLTYISSYIYGIPESLPISETHRAQAFNPYAHSKILAEDLCQFYSKYFNVKTTIVRPFNAYGPEQDHRFLIPELLKQIFTPSINEVLVKDLSPKRDFVYIEDLVMAIVLLYEKNALGVYNIGSGESYSVKEILDKIMTISGIHKNVKSLDSKRKNEVNNVIADISKIKGLTGWEPSFSLDKGLGAIISELKTTS